MSEDSESFLPFIFKVINDIYSRITETGESVEKLNQKMEVFTHTITDSIINLSKGITEIIQIIRTNREASLKFFSDSANELKEEFRSIRDESVELGKLEGQLAQKMAEAKTYLQDKMLDAEFLSLVFELKDISNDLRSIKARY